MDVVTSLINQGKGKVNAIDNFFTPLHCAVQNNQIETAHYLISQGGALEARTISGYSPLRLACGIIQGKLKSKEMVNMLLTFGADQFSMDNWGNTPSDLMMWHEKRRSSSQ
ncbi:Ankyrin repeats (3 copies) [compost metagenome]